ncbi:MAG: glycoside hydrolase family protein [Rikenellaceae bacterium]
MKKTLLTTLATLAVVLTHGAKPAKEIIYRPHPQEWGALVEGAAFEDRIEPMQGAKIATKRMWGADGVRGRYIDNGIEDKRISFWGGNIVQDEEGKYHLFVCGWAEDNPKGHFGYPTSTVYHATCANSVGPFEVVETMGEGHNPEIFRAKDGTWMVYHVTSHPDKFDLTKNLNYFRSKSLNGPWELCHLELDLRDREIRLGGGTWFHNMTFAPREDGSVIMLSRMGSIWISETGESPYHLVTERSIYPLVSGKYEDPVIWRDEVQYNAIVNDWIGRTAFYLRSRDGVNWIQEEGTAYTPGVARHEDGYVEEWTKYERVRILQDERGRAIQMNLAVIDTLKNEDLPNDRYSSKNISLPLNRGMLLSLVDKKPIARTAKMIEVRIEGEVDFDPLKEVDVNTLRLGSSSEVNFGRGAEPISSRAEGADLIVSFANINACIAVDEFALKVIGKRTGGEMLFGYLRLPWVEFLTPIVSARKPVVENGGASIVVENFGQVSSEPTVLTVSDFMEGTEREISSVVVPAIEPYGSVTLQLEVEDMTPRDVVVRVLSRIGAPSVFATQL